MRYINVEQNVKIAVEDINPKGSHTVLFLHGWPLGQKIFEYQADVLPHMDFRVITMDFRGFGKSDAPWTGYSYNELAKDVHKVITTLNAGPLTLAGFSMGGAVAVRYMSLFKGYGVSKLALLGAAAPVFTKRPDYPYGMSVEDVNALIELAYKDRPKMAADFGKMLFNSNPSENMKEWMTEISYEASGHGTIKTAESLRDEDMRSDLSKIKVPTGIFHGKHDKVCPFVFAQLLNNNIKNSILFSFENSGHAIFYDELEDFNKRFVGFLKYGSDMRTYY